MQVAIIGAGPSGAELARLCARAGVPAIIEDVFPDKLRSLKQLLARELESGAPLSFAQTVEDAVRFADIALDSVPDELESKLEIFSLIDRMAPPRTVVCSPLRAVSISDLASCTYRPEQCIAFTLQEESVLLTMGAYTSPATADVAQQLWERLGFKVTREQERHFL